MRLLDPNGDVGLEGGESSYDILKRKRKTPLMPPVDMSGDDPDPASPKPLLGMIKGGMSKLQPTGNTAFDAGAAAGNIGGSLLKGFLSKRKKGPFPG